MTANPSLPVRLLIWLILQLGVLMLGAFGVPISARHPGPPESLAVFEMLACQIGVSALIFPWLLGNWLAAVAIIFSSIPFLLIAGWLSTTGSVELTLCAIHVGIWLASLTVFARLAARSPRLRLLLILLVSLWSIGGAALYCLRLGFAGAANPLLFGPLVSGGKMASGEVSQIALLPSFALLIVALIALRISRH